MGCLSHLIRRSSVAGSCGAGGEYVKARQNRALVWDSKT